jgi:hypothetical protein
METLQEDGSLGDVMSSAENDRYGPNSDFLTACTREWVREQHRMCCNSEGYMKTAFKT